MNYSTLRNQYKSVEQFKRAYARLSEEQARSLIEKTKTSATCKTAMYTTWTMSRKEYQNDDILV